MNADLLVVGAGVVGLAAARAWRRRHPGSHVRILDKEPVLGAHASGLNSGVLHAGLYYAPGSLKARFCRSGCAAWKEFARDRDLGFNECGKLVVAAAEDDLPRLDALFARARENGADVRIVTAAEARDIEPRARTVDRAIWSPTSASIDPVAALEALAAEAGTLELGTAFLDAAREGSGWRVVTSAGVVTAGLVLGAAGAWGDRVAALFGVRGWRMAPFRGLYLVGGMPPGWLRTHVYPVPDPALPFLGVHFTVTADGGVKLGPTASPSEREDHTPGTAEEADAIRARGAALVDGLDPGAFAAWGRPGVRAHVVGPDGLAQDFVIEQAAASVHVLGAVSPAFTAAIPLGEHLADRLEASTVDAYRL